MLNKILELYYSILGIQLEPYNKTYCVNTENDKKYRSRITTTKFTSGLSKYKKSTCH